MPSESNPFVIKPLTKNGVRISSDIYREFEQFYDALERFIPSGRELALTKTKLQEACYWAVEAVATKPEYTRSIPEEPAQPQEEVRMEISPSATEVKEP